MAKLTKSTLEDIAPGKVGGKSIIPSLRGTAFTGTALVDKALGSKAGRVSIDHSALLEAAQALIAQVEAEQGVRITASDDELLNHLVNRRLVPALHMAARSRGTKVSVATRHQVGGKNPREQVVISVVG